MHLGNLLHRGVLVFFTLSECSALWQYVNIVERSIFLMNVITGWMLDARGKKLHYLVSITRKIIYIHRNHRDYLAKTDLTKDYLECMQTYVKKFKEERRQTNLKSAQARRKPSASGRVGVCHSANRYGFIARCGKRRKYFSYLVKNFVNARQAWKKALACRISYERENMAPDNIDYLVETPLSETYWNSMCQKVSKKMNDYKNILRERRVAKKRKDPPAHQGDKNGKCLKK